MLRVPEATDIKLQEEPCEEERERKSVDRERESIRRPKQIAGRLLQVSKTGPGPKVVSWEY